IDAGKNVENNRRELRRLMAFVGINDGEPPREFTNELREAFTRAVLNGESWLVIFQIMDVFGWKSRFNTPGSVSASNWSYRVEPTVAELDQDPTLSAQAEGFSRLAIESGRVHP